MISVCIASHNGGKFIKEQLESILPQLNINDEVIISDDGSTDNTIEEILSISDNRIKLFSLVHTRKNKHPHWYVTKNFENAIKHANGEIIFLADQDDVWLPYKIDECVNEIKGYSAVLHNLECVDSNLIPLGYNWYNENNKFHTSNFLMIGRTHQGCALCFSRNLLNYILPFPNDLYTHDFWIGMLAEQHGGLKYVNKILVKYRIHGNNTSIGSQHKNSFIFKIKYRLYNIWHLLMRI